MEGMALRSLASLLFVAVVAAASSVACGGDDDEGSLVPAKDGGTAGSTNGGTTGEEEEPPQPLPAKLYSGFDGTHTFRVPVTVEGKGAGTLTASDPSMVTITPVNRIENPDEPPLPPGKSFFVEAKKAGTVTLTGAIDGRTSTSTLTITAYQASGYAAGEQRYMNAASARDACIACHQEEGGVDHSPSVLGLGSDAQVVSAMTSGVRISGVTINKVNHKWTLSDAERDGLLVYLRALAPRGFN